MRATVARMTKAELFRSENANLDRREEHLSPSGKYKLVVTPYATKPGCWGYTQGLVYTVGSDTPIAEIQRNYSAFPFLFVEGHPNGHDYLIGGEDYQGQTVIELDTGARRDFLPEAAAKGHGFCWASYQFEPSVQLLVVQGCFWACSYETCFYDFADPMKGWPGLTLEPNEGVDCDVRKPEVLPDGTIRCYVSEYVEDDDDDEEEGDVKKPLPPVVQHDIYKREGDTLVRIERWVDPEEQVRRDRSEEAQRKHAEEFARYKATDALYLAYQQLAAQPALQDVIDGWESSGVTYKGWCPHFEGEERRMCRRLINGVFKKNEKRIARHTVDLEWAALTGPIKLVVFKDGEHLGDHYYEHSVDGMNEAFNHTLRLLRSER